MWSTAREVAAGDLVIIWLTRDVLQPLVITPGKELNSKFGVYRHSDLLGIPYGSKIASRNGKGFIHLLRPTPELWTLALPHRTQILYLADIAFVTSWLNIKPGCRVIEAGTGSGSFSHSVARTIGSTGHLWSYEFHETRANKAREEFSRHGLNDIITLTHRNVCKDGFTVSDTVDAVFLDLPAPWDAVEHAKGAMRKDCPTRICCFSPCMEQVLRTVSALNEAGFTEITMYETLVRPHQIDILPPLLSVDVVKTQLIEAEARRETKRLRQIANSRHSKGEKRKRDQKQKQKQADKLPDTGDEGDGSAPDISTQEGPARKHHKAEHVTSATELTTNEDQDMNLPRAPVDISILEADGESAAVPGDVAMAAMTATTTTTTPITPRLSVSKAFPEVRGHTSYLTFALLLPLSANGERNLSEGRTSEGETTETVTADTATATS